MFTVQKFTHRKNYKIRQPNPTKKKQIFMYLSCYKYVGVARVWMAFFQGCLVTCKKDRYCSSDLTLFLLCSADLFNNGIISLKMSKCDNYNLEFCESNRTSYILKKFYQKFCSRRTESTPIMANNYLQKKGKKSDTPFTKTAFKSNFVLWLVKDYQLKGCTKLIQVRAVIVGQTNWTLALLWNFSSHPHYSIALSVLTYLNKSIYLCHQHDLYVYM